LASPTLAVTPRSARVRLFGLTVDDVTLAEAVERVDSLIERGPVHQHVVINVNKVIASARDAALRGQMNACDLVTVDGQPILWAARLFGRPLRARVTGVDLMLALFARADERRYRVYLLGARPAVIDAVLERLRRDHPNIVIAGARDGYWLPEEEYLVVATIAAARPDILLVAISSPAKEQFIARWKDQLQTSFVMGVGGAFDVYAGRTRRAPRWVQRLGAEWLFRVAQEPRRMWRRYAADAIAFVPILLRELRSTRRAAPHGGLDGTATLEPADERSDGGPGDHSGTHGNHATP
jgi:N-acetylglucosaminyldiphosphoundecaprenol N-acetyl-beta-D-mannosaminyltransferase